MSAYQPSLFTVSKASSKLPTVYKSTNSKDNSAVKVAKQGSLQKGKNIDETDHQFSHENVLMRMQKERVMDEIEKQPGPGHYHLDIQDKIQQLTNQLAPRYRDNPFGSKLGRFKHREIGKSQPLMTEEEQRQHELKRDLEEHTGLQKTPSENRQRFRIQDRISKKPLKLN